MAGSLKWMIYVADDGTNYAVKHDESNGEATGFLDFGGAANSDGVLPRGFKMRGVNLISADGLKRRRLEVGSVTNALYTGETGTITLGEVDYQVTSSYGEKQTRPFALDTGDTDGDAS